MKILFNGNEVHYPAQHFICHECGCAFLATAAEYQKQCGSCVAELGLLAIYECRCPWCGTVVRRHVEI